MIKRGLLGLAVLVIVTGIGLCAQVDVEARVDEAVLGAEYAKVEITPEVVRDGWVELDPNSGGPNPHLSDNSLRVSPNGDLPIACALLSFEVNVSDYDQITVGSASLELTVSGPSYDNGIEIDILAWDPDQPTNWHEMSPSEMQDQLADAETVIGSPVAVDMSGNGYTVLPVNILSHKVQEWIDAATGELDHSTTVTLVIVPASSASASMGRAVFCSNESSLDRRPRLTIDASAITGDCPIEPLSPGDLVAGQYCCPEEEIVFVACPNASSYQWRITGGARIAPGSPSDEMSIRVIPSEGAAAIDLEVTIGLDTGAGVPAYGTYDADYPIVRFPTGAIIREGYGESNTTVCPLVDGVDPTLVRLHAALGTLDVGLDRTYVWQVVGEEPASATANDYFEWEPGAEDVPGTRLEVELYQILSGCPQTDAVATHIIEVREACALVRFDVPETICSDEVMAVNADYDGNCADLVFDIDGGLLNVAAGSEIDVSGLDAGRHVIGVQPIPDNELSTECHGPREERDFYVVAVPDLTAISFPPQANVGDVLSASAPPGMIVYRWTVDGRLVSTSQDMEYEIDEDDEDTSALPIYLYVECAQGCTSDDTWYVTVGEAPNLSISADGDCCEDNCRAKLSGSDEYETVQWYRVDGSGNEIYVGSGGSLRFDPPDDVSEVRVRAKVTYEGLMGDGLLVLDRDFDVDSGPYIEIGGPKIACAEVQAWPYTVSTDAEEFQWSIRQEDDQPILEGDDDDLDIVFPWPGNWTVRVKGWKGDCQNVGTMDVVVRDCGDAVLQVPHVLFAGANTGFPLVGPPGMRTYQWTMTEGWSLGKIQNNTTREATWRHDDPKAGDVSHVVFHLAYTDSDNCLHNGMSPSVPVVQIPDLEITVPRQLCQGEWECIYVTPLDFGTSFAPYTLDWETEGEIEKMDDTEHSICLMPNPDCEMCRVRVRAEFDTDSGSVYGTWSEWAEMDVILRPEMPIDGPDETTAETLAEFEADSALREVHWRVEPNASIEDGSETREVLAVTFDHQGMYQVLLSAQNRGCLIEATKSVRVNPIEELVIEGPGSICVGQEAEYTVHSSARDLKWHLKANGDKEISPSGNRLVWTPYVEDRGWATITVEGRQNGNIISSEELNVEVKGAAPVSILDQDGKYVSHAASYPVCKELIFYVDMNDLPAYPSWTVSHAYGRQVATSSARYLYWTPKEPGPYTILFRDETQPCPAYEEVEVTIYDTPLIAEYTINEDQRPFDFEHLGKVDIRVKDRLHFTAIEGLDAYSWSIGSQYTEGREAEWVADRRNKRNTIQVTLNASFGECELTPITRFFVVNPRRWQDTWWGQPLMENYFLLGGLIIYMLVGFCYGFRNALYGLYKQEWRGIPLYLGALLCGLLCSIIWFIVVILRFLGVDPSDAQEEGDRKGCSLLPIPVGGGGKNTSGSASQKPLEINVSANNIMGEGNANLDVHDQSDNSSHSSVAGDYADTKDDSKTKETEKDEDVDKCGEDDNDDGTDASAPYDDEGGDDDGDDDINDDEGGDDDGDANVEPGDDPNSQPLGRAFDQSPPEPPCVYGKCMEGPLNKRTAAVGAIVTVVWPGGNDSDTSDEGGWYKVEVPPARSKAVYVDVAARHPDNRPEPAVAKFSLGPDKSKRYDLDFT